MSIATRQVGTPSIPFQKAIALEFKFYSTNSVLDCNEIYLIKAIQVPRKHCIGKRIESIKYLLVDTTF